MCYNSNGAYADISNTYWAFTPYCCITWCSNPRARGKRGKSLLITDMFTSNLRRQCKARSRIALVKSHNQKLLLKTRPIFASANLPQNVWFKCMCEKKDIKKKWYTINVSRNVHVTKSKATYISFVCVQYWIQRLTLQSRKPASLISFLVHRRGFVWKRCD